MPPIIGEPERRSRNTTHWTGTVESLRAEEQLPTHSDGLAPVTRDPSQNEARCAVRRKPSLRQATMGGEQNRETQGNDSDDDLDMDLAKAALETGTAAFEAREWEEADAMLREASQALQQLPPNQRTFCDLFALQYQLALCSYHTQEPADAEHALLSLVREPASSSEHRQYLYDARHHLALLYVHLGRIDNAKVECERVLQGRRRLLGKHSEAALQSTALMAHIYGLASNRARAKACLAMIPEARRSDAVSTIEASLGARLTLPERTSVSTHSISEKLDDRGQSAWSDSHKVDPALQMHNRYCGPVSLVYSASPVASLRPSYQREDSRGSGLESLSSLTVTTPSIARSSTEQSSTSTSVTGELAYNYRSPNVEADQIATIQTWESSKTMTTSASKGLQRMEILRNIRCVPSDSIEEAVCKGDKSALAALLKRKRSSSWRSKMQKALHSRRVTALHFAALFGEVEIARDLLSAGYDINEIPESSATRQTPLKFAIGARQVDMVIFLTARGARPIEPDSWSTLAGLLMDRSWLSNTLSMADRDDLEQVPSRIIAILRSWLKKGWDPNAPYNTSGRTLLHQAVAFESGFYKWDANLRGTMTRFLCNEGADPTRLDTKGNSPYDMATVVEDQDVLLVFDQRVKMKDLDKRLDGLAELKSSTSSLVELPAEMLSPVELPATVYRQAPR